MLVFSLIAAIEALENLNNNQQIDCSEQCLYYHCKQIDNYYDDGTWVSDAISTLQKNGICEEKEWPYVANFDPNNISQGPPPSNCNPYPCSSPKIRWTSSNYEKLAGDLVSIIKEKLSNKKPVVVTFPVFATWYNDGNVGKTGEIIMPLEVDLGNPSNYVGNHAVCFAGYNDQDKIFFFKNSWGTNWAYNSVYGSGYGQLPYRYIEKWCIEAYCLLP